MNKNFTEIVQIGLVARDRNKVIESMREILGVEPDQIVRTAVDENCRYHGEPGDFEAELIFYRFANIELEFAIPLRGRNIWQDFIDEHGEGLHHILFNVESFSDASAYMREKGVELMQQGSSVMKVPGLKWGYFDTLKQLSFIIEIKNSKEVLKLE